ncbi:IbrB-like domain-containing protein [Ferviditalea candida]|uniref:ParB/RepB/Spo0J family partition protein n=1 Tax=Ferviditalea candida TaxID=3108399 RepID=A0ABU5ZN53_9BACL|nr:ParB/RepB/Spo0J family partition protein [Paenibacillaceae bacterium T2]
MFDQVIEQLKRMPEAERISAINELQRLLKDVHPIQHPVGAVQWIPAELVEANEYNPNSVAPPEMRLLYHSIKEDGYTQPIVAYWDEERQKYIIVDGFHRHRIGKEYRDIREQIKNRLPLVVINKPIENRMASTIRHNRARGKHSVLGMTNIVVELVRKGWDDVTIAKHLGMDADEVLRLKQTSGIAELFRGRQYSKSWELGGVEYADI